MSEIKLISHKPIFRLNDIIWFYPAVFDENAYIGIEMFQGLILEIFQTMHGIYYKIYLTGASTIIECVPEKNIFVNKRECLKSVLELIRF